MSQSTVLTIGSFDLLHIGHIQFLQKCAKLGTLTVMVNPDNYIRDEKGHLPHVLQDARTLMVRSLACVASAWVYARTPDIRAYIRGDNAHKESPTYLVVGADWAQRDYLAHIRVTEKDLAAAGCTLLYLPRSGAESTSAIVARIREGK